VNADRRRRGDWTELGKDERAELPGCARKTPSWRWRSQAQRGPLGQGRDGAVAVAALIAAQRDQHRIPYAVACRALGVSRSWFYKWNGGTLTPRAARRQALAAQMSAPVQGPPGDLRVVVGS
jgi:hypothetical protein